MISLAGIPPGRLFRKFLLLKAVVERAATGLLWLIAVAILVS